MKRVLLVSSNTVTAPYPVPPLGLCLLAESLPDRFEVRLHDGLGAEPGALEREVADFAPDVVGLGIRNLDELVMHQPHSYVPEIMERFVAPIRATTSAPLVLGGAGYSIFPRELLDTLGADYGVVGEGERAFPALLDRLAVGADARGLPAVLVRAAGVGADMGRGSTGLETLPKLGSAGSVGASAPSLGTPLPAAEIPFSRLDRWVDFSRYRERGSYAIQTKRGCAHRCVYCTYPTLEGRASRLRIPATIAAEIAEASDRLGAVTFEFVDSTFNDPRGHAEQICRSIIERVGAVRLRTMGVNPRGVHSELLELMAQAGFAQIDCTPDSASPAVIEGLGKNFTRPELDRTAAAIREVGMPTMWFFLFGGPGETRETFAESIDFVDRHVDPRDMVFMGAGLRIYPNTRLCEVARAQGVLAPGQPLLTPTFYVSPGLEADELNELVTDACRSRPNCVPIWESTPDPALRQRAAELRAEQGLDEPMFRSLLRARRERMGR